MRGNPPPSLALRALVSLALALILYVVPAGASPPAVEKVKVQAHEGFARVILETNAPVEPNLFTMSEPERLVIDLPELLWRIPQPSGVIDNPMVKKFSFGLFQPGVSRLVLNLSAPSQVLRRKPYRLGRTFFYEIDLAFKQPTTPPLPPAPLEIVPAASIEEVVSSLPVTDVFPVVDLPTAPTVTPATKSVFGSRNFDPLKAQFEALGDALSSTIFDKEDELEQLEAIETIDVVSVEIDAVPDLAPEKNPDLAPERLKTKGINKNSEVAILPKAEPAIKKSESSKLGRSPTRVVIDPGHGGRDPGTGSENGIPEKNINLAFANVLSALLKADPNYEVFMTREEDTSVKLPKRVRFARRKNADLFISIHADWSINPLAKGATAYTLSEEASVEVLDTIAAKGEKVAGVDLAAERADVARLLVDLARRETQARSVKFAELVVAEVAKETPVLRRPLRKNSFHVLKAPDMPSVLLELGFLSNETDRERLSSEVWRLKTAQAVKRAIDKFKLATSARDFATKR